MKQQFSKDGRVTTATSAAEAVRLRFDGWQELHTEPEADTEDETTIETSVSDEPTAPRKRTSSR